MVRMHYFAGVVPARTRPSPSRMDFPSSLRLGVFVRSSLWGWIFCYVW